MSEPIKQVTIASMVNLKRDQSLTIPHILNNVLREEGDTPEILMVYKSDTKVIRFFPTTKIIFQLKIPIKEGRMVAFIRDLGEILVNWKAKSVFNTCECQLQRKLCIYLGYIEVDSVKEELNDLIIDIKALPGVQDVEIQQIVK
jgi:hypothetical protein